MTDSGLARADARVVAARVLYHVIGRGESLSAALPAQLGDKAVDSALVQELCFGTLRWYGRLNRILEQLLRNPLKPRDRDLECLLCLGLYQLIYMRVPAHAAVYSTVEATLGLGKAWARGLANGVLRNFIRNKEDLLQRADRDSLARTSHPRWLLQRLQSVYPKRWEQICEAANRHPPMTLRINRRLGNVSDYIDELRSVGLDAHPHPVVDSAISLHQAVPVQRLPGFSRGLITVQDAAAQLAAYLLGCRPGMRILDACAAPGGKTAHINESVGGDAEVVSVEKDRKRYMRLQQTLDRLGGQVRMIHGDVTRPHSWWDGKVFDRILLDAPCSATGVIRRHPDIKLLRRASDIKTLQNIQRRMLQALWPLLAQGGTLLYVTCSILPEENHLLIQRFLRENDEAVLVSPALDWAPSGEWGWQILPGEWDMDGFYYAQIRKK